jgi:hypothetical protein
LRWEIASECAWLFGHSRSAPQRELLGMPQHRPYHVDQMSKANLLMMLAGARTRGKAPRVGGLDLDQRADDFAEHPR